MAKRNGKGTVTDFHGYTPNNDLGKAGRIAELLDFRATSHPKEFVPYALIAKAIYSFKHTPNANGKDADGIKKLMGQVKVILARDYGREAIALRGYGARASVDSTDTLEKVLTLKAHRLERSRLSFNTTLDLIDSNKVDSKHYLKKWLTASAHDVSRQLEAMSMKILPPVAPQEAAAEKVGE